ncbi:MAG: winged helix-turn-helix transcriptional regulator [Patescibacteria group bacterium]
MHLTKFQQSILYELDKDGRASYSTIAKNTHSTPQTIKYNYEKLMNEGYIKHFWAFVDYDLAGYSFFWGYWLKFAGLTKSQETKMYQDFTNNQFIPIIMRTDGYADVMLGIIAKDVFHHNEVLNSVFAKYGQYISSSDIVVGLGFIKFPRSYLANTKNTAKKFYTSGGTPIIAKLTEIDRKIISLLQIDGRLEFTKIARLLNVSTGLIHQRFKKLQAEKVITKITYTMNYQKLGLHLYRCLFKIIQFDSRRVQDLYNFCAIHPHIINYVKVMGNWQLMLDIEIDSRENLRDLIRELRHRFQDIIHQIAINEVYQIDKFTQMAIEYPATIQNTSSQTLNGNLH